MRSEMIALAWCALLPAAITGCGMREEEVDPDARNSRREMAGLLDSLRTVDDAGERNPAEVLGKVKILWKEKVRPWMEKVIRENRHGAQKKSGPLGEFDERLASRMESRIQTVDGELKKIEKAREGGAEFRDLDKGIREIIWALSHQPEGFEAPPPAYTWKDWTIGLGIGFGHLALILLIAFYLRRRYRVAIESKTGGS